uniref:Uncharacterized protein n=1 Tax=Acrobeloides nanus TaxID=290746 RepID=A0A914CUQ8_9BILA
MREEQAVVSEIDKLKRNITKLAKYMPLIDERKRLEESMKSARQSLRDIRSKMREKRDKMFEGRARMKKLQQPYMKIRSHINELKAERRALIDEYEHERKSFAGWVKDNKFDKAISTFPTAMLQENICDDLEPFHEKKRTCNRLIQYLNRLISACDDDHAAGGTVDDVLPPTGGDTSDSADEFPKAFEKLSIKLPPGNPKTKKRVNIRKGAKKQNMPITHGIDYIKLFGDLDLLPPKTYGEAEGVLVEVKKILTFYEEQTSIEAENDYELCISPIPSIISISGSENFDSPLMSPRSSSSCSLVLREESHDSSRTSDQSFR